MGSLGISGIPRYLGRALVAREAGEGAYLFSTIPYADSGNPLVVPSYLCMSIGNTRDT